MNLEKFKNIHKGKRAFLIAGGPSLNNIDLSRLKNDLIYSVSLTYKADLPHINYHFIGDMNITKQFHLEISEISADYLFVSSGIYNSGIITHPKLCYFLGHAKPRFYGHDITHRIYGGGTSSFLGMQFAFYMGIETLYIVGLDHKWTYDHAEKTGKFVNNKELLRTTGGDFNHFSADYFKDGTEWFEQNMVKMEQSYRWANEAFIDDGRRLLNASAETALSSEIISRVEFSTLWREG